VTASSPDGAAAPASPRGAATGKGNAAAGAGAAPLVTGAGAASPATGRAPAAASHPAPDDAARPRRTPGQVAKDIVLFFAAPWVTMGCLAMFPVMAMKMLAQARRERKQAA
jgi:hypothetical protein